ncbi:MAG TPA: hypothetical protein VFS21_40240 [Roseiflexaceae bacterium]|nr:hypothetical protein [Roseiflexaceae bacterium]
MDDQTAFLSRRRRRFAKRLHLTDTEVAHLVLISHHLLLVLDPHYRPRSYVVRSALALLGMSHATYYRRFKRLLTDVLSDFRCLPTVRRGRLYE